MKTFSKLSLITLTLFSVLLLAGCAGNGSSDRVSSDFKNITRSGQVQPINGLKHDWGKINIKGGDVEHTFTFKNTGQEDVYLKSAKTSCMCTTARYRLPDGSISPEYGMHQNPTYWAAQVKPGETFDVEVVFDPLAHGPDATGPIQRTVTLLTSARENGGIVRLDVLGDVLSEDAYQAAAEEKRVPEATVMGDFVFQEKEFDFGTLKQSGGIVSHDFPFTYTGETPVTITGTPGSCACTTGEVSPKGFKQGDEGVFTVYFDPNLHEEPEGKFYKTVSILTDPKAEVIPEVKIWAEIDLDLGPEAYKLKTHEDREGEHDDEVVWYNGKPIALMEPEGLKEALGENEKDFFLLDVHIPEQEHIPGTDAFIDYRTIKESVDQLPPDKSAKIVVYCRSGSMSRSAAQDLVDLGYSNVYDLEGGIKAYNDQF